MLDLVFNFHDSEGIVKGWVSVTTRPRKRTARSPPDAMTRARVRQDYRDIFFGEYTYEL